MKIIIYIQQVSVFEKTEFYDTWNIMLDFDFVLYLKIMRF